MFKIKKQMYCLLVVSALSSFEIAGTSWVALLAARGFSMVEIGLAESCFHVASLLFEIPSGVISDVFGRKRSMVLSQCMFILSSICMIFSRTMIGICFSLMISAWGYNFASGSKEALAYDSLKLAGYEERYMEFSAKELSIYRIGNALAILCVGVALSLGYQRANFLDAVLGLICLFFSCQLKEVEMEEKQFEGKLLTRIGRCFQESFYFLTHNFPTLRLMLWNGIVGATAILTVFFLQAKLPLSGVSNTLLGPMLFAVSLGGAIGARLVVKFSHWKYWQMSILCVAGVIIGVFCGVSGLSIFMCIGGFVANLCDDMLQVRTDAILNDRFPSAQRATLISVESLCFSVVMIVLSPLAGCFFGK